MSEDKFYLDLAPEVGGRFYWGRFSSGGRVSGNKWVGGLVER